MTTQDKERMRKQNLQDPTSSTASGDSSAVATRRTRCTQVLVLAIVLFCATAPAQSSYINFEGKQTNPVRLSPDGRLLFAVNTPDARLSVFNVENPSNPILIAEIPVGIEPVSVNPLSNDEAWVVNEVSDSVSIVSVSRGIVTDTIYVKDEPADVVFAAGRAFVSAARKNQIAVFDATSHALVTNITVFGENPRALAVSVDGSKVYAAFALSGNHTTLIPFNLAPPQSTNSPFFNTNLPAPPQVGLIVDATNVTWFPSVIKYTMPDNDIVEIDTGSLAINRYFSRVGTVNLGLAVNPASGDLYVANTDAGNLVHFEPNVRGHFVTNRISRVAFANGAVTPFNLNPDVSTNLPDLSAKTNALAQPTAVIFDPGGSFMYVAAFGTDRIARVDTNGNVLARIDIGPAIGSSADPRNKRGPRGLALNANSQRLYVMNRIANTISVVNIASDTVEREVSAGSYDPTSATIRQGRGFLYDAKLSGNGTVSCSSCHVDAEMDLIAWDLGDPGGSMTSVTNPPPLTNQVFQMHPMKGPMTTQTLRGLNGLDPLHWRGDRTNFLHFNIAFNGLMGGSPLSSADMQAYRGFINTVVLEPNPNQNLDRTFPTNFAGGNAKAGFTNFTVDQYTSGLSCNTCHALPTGTAKALISAKNLRESQAFKIPQLRNIYQKLNLTHATGAQSVGGFGLVHDGTDPDLGTFLSRPVFDTFSTNNVIKSNLNAFVQCFDTGTAPAVGYTRTVTAANVNSASVSNDWNLLESQAAVTNIDLIVKGTIDGGLHGLLYQPGANNYRTDKTGVGPFTRAELVAKILAGDTLSPMGVPPGAGLRMSIDRDLDGILDGDVTPPLLQVQPGADSAVLLWPSNSFWFVLESTDALPPFVWTTVTDVRGIIGDQAIVTNGPVGHNRFYRLRRPW